MMTGYHMLTLTYRDAPLDAIGQAMVRSGDSHDPAETLHRLKTFFQWEELAYWSTCNRVAYFFYGNEPLPRDLARALMRLVRPDLCAADTDRIAARMRLLHGADAIRHLLEVGSSIDSLVVGEREIVRQLREAFERSRQWKLSGDHLRLLFNFTLETAKEIYTTTGIGQKALSIVALAFAELRKTGLQPDSRILLVGAGQTNERFARFLAKYGYRNVVVFNRTPAKAAALAGRLNGRSLPLDALKHYSEGFDALVVCTGATEPIITPAVYRQLLAGDATPKVVVDLSVPNNVARDVAAGFPLRYIPVEGLREAARENLAWRERERARADAMLHEKIRAFRKRWHERQIERSLAPVVVAAHTARERAAVVFAKELNELDPATQELVHRMLDYVGHKCVGAAMQTVKAVAADPALPALMRFQPVVAGTHFDENGHVQAGDGRRHFFPDYGF